MQLKALQDEGTARLIGQFLTGPDVFDHQWAPNEKNFVKQAVLDSLKSPHHQYWYVEEKGKIIATIGIRENKYQSGGYEMDQDYLAVHREHRRKGLATRLLRQTERFVKQNKGRYIHILCCDINSYIPARDFYQKHGYHQVGHIPDYYVVGEGRVDYFKKMTE